MSDQAGRQQTVGDALARRVEARRGPASALAEALRELGAVDQAVYEAVVRTPTAELAEPVRRLSDAANHSRLWLGIAAVIALLGGGRGRRAALEGVLAIGVTSATVNLGVKPIAQRPRPDRASLGSFPGREVQMPQSTSPRRPSRSPTPRVGTCPAWPCRSGCSRAQSRTRACTPACTTRATW